MKLRNKKTGEIKSTWSNDLCINFGDCNQIFSSLAELNEWWEDYTPAEPLIKDEKIRKAVRAWADYNGVEEVTYFESEDDSSRLVCHSVVIDFYEYIYGLEDYKKYTITELCGEEEE